MKPTQPGWKVGGGFTTSSPASVLVVLLLVSPVAVATWAAKGEVEPNTPDDLGWVWADPPPPGTTTRIYFNGFVGTWAGAGSSLNPNHHLVESRVAGFPYQALAMLGLWVDCNGDGYVGHGLLGAMEYDAGLLDEPHPCPATTDPQSVTHNDGRWVQEFLPIGYDDVRTPHDENPYNIRDQGARVWADWGRPGEAPVEACGDVPLPRSTLRSTGGMLGFVDCRLGHRALGTWDEFVEHFGLGSLSFGDAPRERPGESASPLNVRNPWGSEGDRPMASAVDCGAPPAEVGVADPTDSGNGDGALHSVRIPVFGVTFNATDHRGRFVNTTVRPVAPAFDTTGSVAGTVNETQAGTSDCRRDDKGSVLTYDGERRGSDGDLPYLLESSGEGVSGAERRKRTDLVFTFEEGVRDPRSVAAPLLGRRFQADAGTGLAAVTGFWLATSRETRDPFLSRNSFETAPVTHITFYAHVSPGLAEPANWRLPHSPAFYAVDCAKAECDAKRWWRTREGVSFVPRDARLGADPSNPALPANDPATEIGVRSGQLHQLRDTDCYDLSMQPARTMGVHYGAFTGTACDPSSAKARLR